MGGIKAHPSRFQVDHSFPIPGLPFSVRRLVKVPPRPALRNTRVKSGTELLRKAAHWPFLSS